MLFFCLILITGLILLQCCGEPTFSVSPSTNILVNQTLALQCLYSTDQPGVSFTLPDNIVCLFAYWDNGCQDTICMGTLISPECPNNRTYIISLNVSASWNNEVLYCSPPFSVVRSNNVTMKVKVPTKSVILNPTQVTVNTGKSITLTCQTDYCNPTANITWFKSSYDITSSSTSTTDVDSDGFVRTTYVLQYTFVREDNGQQVHCTASNSDGQIVTSSLSTLDVRYISEVRVLPVSALNIVAGQSHVWIRCYVQSANPGNNVRYTWTRIKDMNSSTVSTTQSYVIESVDVGDSGRYICTARNSAGSSSEYVDINVQLTPLTPVVLQVVCKSNHAIIIWTSRHPEYDDVEHQETLQLSKKDNTFNNATYEKLNDTHAGIHLYKVNVLKPNTKYIFRVLASNRHGTAFSNNPSCITDLEQVEESSGGCDVGQVVGGTVGGTILVAFFVATAVIMLFKYRKEKTRNDKTDQLDHEIKTNNVLDSRQQGTSYVDQLSPDESHPYQGIGVDVISEMPMTNTYEDVEASHLSDQRAEYMDLTDQSNTNEEGHDGPGILYTNLT
ncbi:cell adhesion molecule 2-like isoform X2 [Ostrea edulis]|uniref:cell adhesion molecule 2-like isoform X2 n=1 Tax=Ostrea edulis TaxID=37623 RepID=UPI0024AEA64F|nr:cell adhesion molecule 2-like isoform X2 [Ostrea edulis]